MKSLKEISWNVTEAEYRKDPSYSYSTISKFDREGFNNLNTLFDRVDSPSLLFGSCVDAWITGSKEEFDSLYIVSDYTEPSDKQKSIIEYIFNITKGNIQWNKIENTIFENAVKIAEYQPNWRLETRTKVIKEIGKEYYDLLCISNNKTIISQSLYNDVYECVKALKNSEATRWYFQKDNPFDGIERLYQLKFKGHYNEIPLRGMLDLVIVDHTNKIIYPCDLKTSFKKEWDFPKSFVEWGYYHQAQLYSELLMQNTKKDDYFRDFKIAPYTFIVVSNGSRMPLTWKFNQTFSTIGTTLGDINYRGWREVVKELDYYIKHIVKVPIGIHENQINIIEDYFKS